MMRSKGYTLIELLIAMGLGAFLLTGLVQIFSTSSQSIRLVNASARVQEGGRIAMELLSRDIRMADYWGCAPGPSTISNNLDETDTPDYTSAMHALEIASGVVGENDVPVSRADIGGVDVVEGSDVLSLRGASALSGVKVVTPYMTTTSAGVHVNDNSGIPKGTVLLISDCSGGDYFSTTGNNTGNNLLHNDGFDTEGVVKNKTKNFSRTYKGDAVILSSYTKIYFLGKNNQGSNSLYRYDSEDAELLELVPNVTSLNFTYGEDTRNDAVKAADLFRNAAMVSNMDNVISVQVEIGIKNSGSSATTNTSVARNYSSTVTIRNRLL